MKEWYEAGLIEMFTRFMLGQMTSLPQGIPWSQCRHSKRITDLWLERSL
jgi:hypothetical protein